MGIHLKRRIRLDTPSSSMKTASIAQLGSKVINVVVQLVITMVLARLLTPAEYGTVAVLTAFSGVFTVLADAGIPAAIAQSQELSEDDYARLFFLSLLMGVTLSLAFFLLSIGVAWFYGDPIYVPLGALMTLAVLFNSLNMVPNGVLMKERKFKLIAVRLVVCTVVVGAIAILLAYLGFGCYAIVMNTVLTSLFVLIWNLFSSHLKMSIGDLRSVLQKVGSFSVFNMGSNLIGWFAANADSLMTGKLFGPTALGYYNKAYNLYGYPLTILTAPITDTLLPFLAPLKDDKEALFDKFIRAFKKISFASAFCTAGMNVCAAEIILILYGDTWAPAIPLLSVLALAVYSRGVNGAFAALMASSGRSDLLMLSTGVNTAVTLAMIIAGGAMGSVQSLATCVAIAYNAEMILPVYLCSRKCLSMSPARLLSHMLPDMLLTVVTIVSAELMSVDFCALFQSVVCKALYIALVMVGGRAILGCLVYHERPSAFLL